MTEHEIRKARPDEAGDIAALMRASINEFSLVSTGTRRGF